MLDQEWKEFTALMFILSLLALAMIPAICANLNLI